MTCPRFIKQTSLLVFYIIHKNEKKKFLKVSLPETHSIQYTQRMHELDCNMHKDQFLWLPTDSLKQSTKYNS